MAAASRAASKSASPTSTAAETGWAAGDVEVPADATVGRGGGGGVGRVDLEPLMFEVLLRLSFDQVIGRKHSLSTRRLVRGSTSGSPFATRSAYHVSIAVRS